MNQKEWKKFLSENPDFAEELLHDAILGSKLSGKFTVEEWEFILKFEKKIQELNFFGD